MRRRRSSRSASPSHGCAPINSISRRKALTEAAYISAELKDVDRTRRFANRARLLALSPVLTDAQRSEFRARLGNDTAFQSLLAFADKR
jgi:hypothetical protein